MKRLLVLAGFANEAAAFAREHGLPISNIAYVVDERNIRGLRDPAYVVTGTFWHRADALEIWERLQLLMHDTSRCPLRIPVAAPPPQPKEDAWDNDVPKKPTHNKPTKTKFKRIPHGR